MRLTREEKATFVINLIRSVENAILDKLDSVPEEWDGHELRQLIADWYAQASWTLREKRRRYRQYRKVCRVRNLI